MQDRNESSAQDKITKLSVVIPCFNEERTLQRCVERVREIADAHLRLEIIIVDDHSTDKSPMVCRELESKYPELLVLRHEHNQGKGAALRTGFRKATGDFVAVQDADLEYDPHDLKKLLDPLIKGEADVVIGSRFLSHGAHRVLYFWHYLGNRFLTFLSNMFTDLNLSDMESCYKVFRRSVVKNIEIKENRFGFDPEIVAQIAHMRLRIFEMGISYYGRTYEEGKKIGIKDAFRVIFCIFRYNVYRAPIPIQFFMYALMEGVVSLINLFVFLAMLSAGVDFTASVLSAFVGTSFINYLFCVSILFKHKARWNALAEVLVYILVVSLVAFIDLEATQYLLRWGWAPAPAKIAATGVALIFNYAGRRLLVFPDPATGPWRPQDG